MAQLVAVSDALLDRHNDGDGVLEKLTDADAEEHADADVERLAAADDDAVAAADDAAADALKVILSEGHGDVLLD